MSGNQAQAGSRITASWLNLNIPAAWQPVTLSNTWANSGGTSVTFQARQYNSVTLEVIGVISGGATAAGTVIGTIPTALGTPATVQPKTGSIVAGTGAGTEFEITVQTNGQIQIGQAITGATEIGFHFSVSLDA